MMLWNILTHLHMQVCKVAYAALHEGLDMTAEEKKILEEARSKASSPAVSTPCWFLLHHFFN